MPIKEMHLPRDTWQAGLWLKSATSRGTRDAPRVMLPSDHTWPSDNAHAAQCGTVVAYRGVRMRLL